MRSTHQYKIVKKNDLNEKLINKLHDFSCKNFERHWTKKDLKQSLQDPFTFLHLLLINKEIYAYALEKTIYGQMHLLQIAANLTRRRSGLGSTLMQYLVKKQDLEQIYLEVACSNIAAIKFYENKGFVVAHKKKAFYRDGEAAYIMTLGIK